MKEQHPSTNENTIPRVQAQELESIQPISSDHTSENQKISDLTFYKSK
jgi:hypothetical protein